MKKKKITVAVLVMIFVGMAATSSYAFGPYPFGLGALGAALGYAIDGTARAAAIGGAAGLVAGALLTPWYYPPRPAVAACYVPPPRPACWVPPPARIWRYPPPPRVVRYYRVPPFRPYYRVPPRPYCPR